MADVEKQEIPMSDVEKQIQDRLEQDDADIEGAEELIEAHIDEVSGGGFSLHVNFNAN